MNQEKDGSVLGTIATFVGLSCFAITIAGSYLAYNTYVSKYQLSKAQFICTKIEQVGKNMDDVICTQYTNQKYAKEAVALNKSADMFLK
jgi:hypothetical protein